MKMKGDIRAKAASKALKGSSVSLDDLEVMSVTVQYCRPMEMAPMEPESEEVPTEGKKDPDEPIGRVDAMKYGWKDPKGKKAK